MRLGFHIVCAPRLHKRLRRHSCCYMSHAHAGACAWPGPAAGGNAVHLFNSTTGKQLVAAGGGRQGQQQAEGEEGDEEGAGGEEEWVAGLTFK